MAFLRNRAVNWINLHSGIQALAQGMGGVFVLAYLLRAGVSVPASLCAMALIFAGRFAIRPVVVPAAIRFGLKPLIIGGNLIIALQYPLLARVHDVDESLVLYCLVSALGDTFYWTCFHAYFALVGDSEHRGHQVSAGVALSAVVGIVAPLIGAWSLGRLGAPITFGVVGLVQALAAAPLLALPRLAVERSAPGALRFALPGIGLFMADGWFTVTYFMVWQIALFLSLGSSYSVYGGAMAIAALVGAASALLLGRHIDAGHGRRGVVIAFSAISLTVLVRAASLGTPWLAVAANALSAIATCLLVPAVGVPVYNLSKISPCALRFNIAAEGGWDIGCFTGCLVTAALIAHGATLAEVIPLGFLGMLGQVLLLRRYYVRLAAW
jgi:hypothetical protein